jgi:hypothetical protein
MLCLSPLGTQSCEVKRLSRTAVIWAMVSLSGFICVLCAASIPWLQGLSIAAVLALTPLLLSHFELPNLVLTFLVTQNLIHLLKRAVFLFGHQSKLIYLVIQLLPLLVFLVVCVSAIRLRRRIPMPTSAKLLGCYLAIALATTIGQASAVPWEPVVAAIHQQLLPFALFFVGIYLTLEDLARIGRYITVLAVLSVGYGFFQLTLGPTSIDRLWAAETYSYSIHANKVFAYLTGYSPDFRAFSYHADPLTWGLFLFSASITAAVACIFGKIGRAEWRFLFSMVLLGLFLSLTRTSWAGLLVTLGAYGLLKRRLMWRPWLVFLAVFVTFAFVVVGGEYVYREFHHGRLPVPENTIAARYLTIGTLEARISAFQSLQNAILTSPILGKGYGVMLHAHRSAEASRLLPMSQSHNFLVELVFTVGVPGAMMFMLFYFQWLREGISVVLKTHDLRVFLSLRWIIAFSIGSMITGYLNGGAFMTYEFFLILGVLAGHALRTGAPNQLTSPILDLTPPVHCRTVPVRM